MPKISEAEARALLSRPLRCEGDFAWTPLRTRPESRTFSTGILDETGQRTHMVVQFKYTHQKKPIWTKYQFSVLIDYGYGMERVYQLEVVHAAREPQDTHSESHEHIGDRRSIGQAGWQRWGYDEVLAHFCAQTNITFAPPPPCP
jgi:hypothetical protein